MDKGFHEVADQLEYEAHTADSFFQLIAENVPQAIDEVILRQLACRERRGTSRILSEDLAAAGCPTFAQIVNEHLRALSARRTPAGIAASVKPIIVGEPIEAPADQSPSSAADQSGDDRFHS